MKWSVVISKCLWFKDDNNRVSNGIYLLNILLLSKKFRSITKTIIYVTLLWAPSSEFVSSSSPSWQILTAHAQPFRGARGLAFCLKVPLDSLLVRASSGGSGETARMRRLAWTFAARIGDKYQIRLTRSLLYLATQKVAGYYVIPSETFECPSVHLSVSQRFVSVL